MAGNWVIEQDIDLRCGAQTPQIWPNALMLIGDNLAHTWRVRVFDGGGAVALTGATVTGYFVRTDGNTVAVQGSVEGSTAIVTLAQACYAFEGDLKGVMRLTLGGKTVTLSVLTLMVRKVLTDAIIDPGNVIPSLEDLLAQIEAMEKATVAANTAAGAANAAATAATSAASAANTAATVATNAANTANTGETARVAAEKNQASAETARANAETQRANAEGARATAEQGRVTAEQGRVAAEQERVVAEQERASAEAARETAETARRAALGGLSFAVNADDGGLDITYTYTESEG